MADDLHGMLTSQFAAAANTEPEPTPEPEVVETPEPQQEQVEAQAETTEQKAERLRDEKGKFAKKPDEPVQQTQPPQPAAQPQAAEPLPERPRTWKKDYLPLWDKVAKGEALTAEEGRKLAAYQTQRENEYQAGINQYKSVAQQAQHLTEALTPYVPFMQRNNVQPAAMVQNLGKTYATLVEGTIPQRAQAIAELAASVGVPPHLIAQINGGGQVDPVVPQLLQQIENLKSEVHGVKSWREQQEVEAAQSIYSKFVNDTESHPHFELVREDMRNLLLQGHAKTLEEAYTKAVRLNDAAWEAEQERQAQLRQPVQQQNSVVKAKAAAVSPKSSAPSGMAGQGGSGEIADLLRRGFAQHAGRV